MADTPDDLTDDQTRLRLVGTPRTRG
jgi:hypothetical protein